MTNQEAMEELVARIKIELPGYKEEWYHNFIYQCVEGELQILRNQIPCDTCHSCIDGECMRGDWACEYLTECQEKGCR